MIKKTEITKNRNYYVIPIALLWIAIAIWLALKVQYQDRIAEVADPLGTSTPGETFLRVFIVILSLLPGTFILSRGWVYTAFTNKNVRVLLTVVSTTALTLLLYYYVFGWLDLVINF